MRKHLLTISLAFMASAALFSCKEEKKDEVTTDMIFFEKSASDSVDVSGAPAIQFENKEFDFGTVIEGEKVKHTFKFINEGKSPLLITEVNPSCGCTTTKGWPKKPISPGESGEIEIEFDSNRRPGETSKTISVITNSVPSTTILKLKGLVVGPDEQKKLQQ
ncbi:DUF1573 domain-containing protein [Halocola ammonii]